MRSGGSSTGVSDAARNIEFVHTQRRARFMTEDKVFCYARAGGHTALRPELSDYSSVSPTIAMCSSSSCFCSTVEGAPIIMS